MMEIEQKQIDNMNQLDRIEYLFRLDKIERKNELIEDIGQPLWIGIFLMLLWISAFGIKYLYKFMPVMYILFGWFILINIFNFIILIRYKKQKKELDNKFFQIVKKKK